MKMSLKGHSHYHDEANLCHSFSQQIALMMNAAVSGSSLDQIQLRIWIHELHSFIIATITQL